MEEVCNRIKIQHEYANEKHCWNGIVDSDNPLDSVKFGSSGEIDGIGLCE